jgi:spermidine/putrescine transport system substrate-binding protein
MAPWPLGTGEDETGSGEVFSMKRLYGSRRRFLAEAAGLGLMVFGLSGIARPALAQGKGLTVMDWTGYEVPELHQAYIAQHGSSPDITIFSDLEEAWQKIAAGFQPDVMHADHWQIPPRTDLFEPWDTARLAHFGDLMPELVNLPTLRRDGRQYGVPADWGINSICIRTDLVNLTDESWASLWDKAHEGRIAMTAQMNDAVLAAGLALGIRNPFVDDSKVMSAIEAKLREQRPLLRFYWSDPTQLSQAMATGEVAIAFAWPAVYKELKAKGLPVRYLRPKEGVMGWAQGLLLMKNRPGDTQKAYDFVNAWTDPATGRWLIENYGYGHANRKSAEGVAPDVLADIAMDDPLKTLGTAAFTGEMPLEVQQAYVSMYERIKAGG